MRGIIDDYVGTKDFSRAEVGYLLDDDERARRILMQSLLQSAGMEQGDVAKPFGAQLDLLMARGFVETTTEGHVRLTAEGLAWSDSVGPMFFSERVRAAMRAYELK
ncbi:MAG: hypothetical protein AUG49_00560 [Catenulispora sp. 13_1_20CM_3_70_7]|nr:MAG: hypothetical protein AUG49_00560 [Catenulispora sp. 13_1_20CM_3_70_7]